ncbi:MAG: hypothetical protein IJP17_03910 [Clostridia bacterium]|nr:hypothetical protein [Clostridia bacterium]
MKENICTIPVNEIFEEKGGCPICRMRNLIEEKYIDYITGAAMMEPAIRVMTNKQGFCERHFNDMLNLGRQRLPICLMLESHIGEIGSTLLKAPDSGSMKKLAALEESCFVCDYIERHLARALDTLYRSYRNEEEFRALFAGQEYLCLPHYRRMVTEGKKTLGKSYGEFCRKAHELTRAQCDLLEAQLKGFEDAFDHRNAGKPMPAESRDSIERSVQFITSRHPKKDK